MKYKKIFINHLALAVIIFSASFGVSYLFGAWFGYPRGNDALFHLFKSQYILQNWPYHHWWHIWAGGMPLFLYYPPLPHYIIALLKLVTGVPFELLLNITAILAVGFTALALYLLVFRLTKNRIFSFLASLLYLTCPSSWETAFSAGVYMRALAMPFFTFGLYFSILFWQKFEKGLFNKKLFTLTSLFWGLTVLTHQHVALVGYATFAFLTFFIIKGKFLTKTMTFVRIILTSLLLSATFWLPLLIFLPKTPTITWVSPFAKQAVPWKNLIPLPNLATGLLSPTESYGNLGRLTPFLLPLAILLAFLILLVRFRRLKKNDFLVRILEFSGWMILFWLVYSTSNLLRLERIFPLINTVYSFMGTLGATWFLPIFISLTIGILLSLLLAKKRLFSFLITGTLIFALTLFMREQYLGISHYLQKSDQPTHVGPSDFTFVSPSFENQIKNQQEDNFRLALGGKALSFSNQFPSFSQTGHYFIQGVANFDLYYYLENTFWRGEKNENETRFLLDWWAIKPILAQSSIKKFNQEDFERIGSEGRLSLYTYRKSSPLLSPIQAPTILVIGSQKAYQTSFFRALAIGNLGSNLLIPLPGKPTAEDYNWKSLSEFDLVFLYDYQIRLPLPWSAKILSDYVKNGGNLIIESSRELEANQVLPEPFPIKRINPSSRNGKWNFKIEEENPYLNQTDLESFSPAQYEGGWGTSEGIEVKDWAKTILTSDGKPVLVEGKLGKGRVLWSGINLPFHIVENKNQDEAQLLKNILLGLSFSPSQDLPKFKVEFENPQKRNLLLEDSARGVLFKENYFPNWEAVAKTVNKDVKLKIYPAGPGFMFAYLPKGTEEVVFLYRRSLVEKIADLISLATFSWLILLLISNQIKKSKKSWSFRSKFSPVLPTQQ